MKTFKGSLMAVAVCVGAVSAYADAVIGRFQTGSSVATMSRESSGIMRMTLEAPKAIAVAGKDAARLSLMFDIRVTRADGDVGADSLKFVQGGGASMTDPAGVEVFRAGSPVSEGVVPIMRRAGTWMTASYPLAKMNPCDGGIGTLFLSLYNDLPKQGVQCGVAVEVRNARVVEMSAGEAALAAEKDAKEAANPRTVCNPIDLEYMIQRRKQRKDGSFEPVMTESADPALVVFKGEYWLFASHGDGYWVSKDMGKWEFIPVDVEKGILSEFRRYAPATCVVGDWLYLTHSESGKIIRTKNPRDLSAWEDVGRPQGWMDPGMLYDDPATGGDGYVYLYKGLSHFEPIDVIKLDPKDGMKKVVPENYHCAWPDRNNRGFEVPGDDSLGYDGKDTQEGAWPVKYNGRYYLTCAVPGTQYASYCDNCYVGDSPIGPFRLCMNSPAIWKSTGYTRGAGHGCLFEDLNGHWWKVDTCRLVGFDRRLVIVPAMFDVKGDLYTNAALSDWPFFVPGASKDPFNAPGPGWNLLSCNKRAVASSNSGTASLALDEDLGTCWTAASGKAGEWLAVDLGKVYGIWSVQVNFTSIDATAGGRGEGWAYRYLVEFSQNGKDWFKAFDRSNAKSLRQHEYVEFAKRVGARFVRVTNRGDSPAGSRFAINGLRVFGEGGGAAPEAVDMSRVFAERRAGNNRAAALAWPKAKGAQGYIVRYGIAPDKLYTHYQVMGSESVVVNTLIRGVDYYATVDSYNESGVTRGTRTVRLPATEGLVEGYDMRGDSPSPAITNRVVGVAVYEAEKAMFAGEGVKPEYEVRASGAKALWGLGAKGTCVDFAKVESQKAGAATMRVSYATPFDAKVGVSVNGGKTVIVTLPATRGWPTYMTIDVPVDGLKRGAGNTIRIEGLGDAFHIDYIQVLQ
jgi:hypothetical protein